MQSKSTEKDTFISFITLLWSHFFCLFRDQQCFFSVYLLFQIKPIRLLTRRLFLAHFVICAEIGLKSIFNESRGNGEVFLYPHCINRKNLRRIYFKECKRCSVHNISYYVAVCKICFQVGIDVMASKISVLFRMARLCELLIMPSDQRRKRMNLINSINVHISQTK